MATRTDSELQEVLGGEALASFDLSFFSSATAPQLVGGLLAKVGTKNPGLVLRHSTAWVLAVSSVCACPSAVPPHCSWWAGLGWAELLIVAAAGSDACHKLVCLPAPEQGTPGEQDVFVKRLRHMLGDLTFMEAFHHTGANHHSTTLLDGCLCLFGLVADRVWAGGDLTFISWRPSTTRVRNA